MHATLMANGLLRQPFDGRELLFYARSARGPGRDVQVFPGNFPKPPQAKRRFGVAAGHLR
jgi:hypothetical protein